MVESPESSRWCRQTMSHLQRAHKICNPQKRPVRITFACSHESLLLQLMGIGISSSFFLTLVMGRYPNAHHAERCCHFGAYGQTHKAVVYCLDGGSDFRQKKKHMVRAKIETRPNGYMCSGLSLCSVLLKSSDLFSFDGGWVGT